MMRLRDAYALQCHMCGREIEVPVHTCERTAVGEQTVCACGAVLLLQWRPPEANPDLAASRDVLLGELDFQRANLTICRTRPRLMTEVRQRIEELKSQLVLLGAEVAA